MVMNRLFYLILGAIALSGCSDVENKPGAQLEISPDILKSCAVPVVATVTWNVIAVHVLEVKIYAVDSSGIEKLFAAGGPAGSAKTGDWVQAGTTFVLRDGINSNHLFRRSVRNDPC